MAHPPAHQQPYDLIYGVHPLRELLRAKRRSVYAIFITNPPPEAWKPLLPLVPNWVQIHQTTREALNRMTGCTDHQGIAAHVAPFPFRKKPFDPARQPLVVLLDGVQDARNLGAIIRSASVVGAQGVIMCKKGGSPLNGAAIKASAGLAEQIEIMEAITPLAAARELKAAGYQLYVAALGGGDIRTIPFAAPACIVIGSEGVGVSAEIRKMGIQVMLPQRSPDISYNASVAAGIMLFMVAQKLEIM